MSTNARIDELRDRVALLEEQVRKVCAHIELPLPEPSSEIPDSVVTLALAGKESAAAAEYRRLTGATLQHALKVVKGIGA